MMRVKSGIQFFFLSMCLMACATGTLFAQSDGPLSGKTYGQELYGRIMQLNPDSLLHAHANPAVYDRYISTENGCDSVFSIPFNKWFYINRDEFYRVIATGPSYETFDYVCATYNGYFYHLPYERKQQEVALMEQAAKKYPGDALLNEAAHLKVWFNNVTEPDVWISELKDAIKALERRGATYWALRVKWHLFTQTAGFGTSYPVAFSTAEELIEQLDGLDERQYPFKRTVYLEIGNLYYLFHDYETAVPLLMKATSQTPGLYFDRSNLRARNTLAIYYRNADNHKRSNDYFISILESNDTIVSRAVHDAVAIANLAHNLAKTGLCREAIGLYELSLPIMIEDVDYSFASGITVGMAECYMNLGEWDMAKQWVDTSLVYIREHIHYMNPHRARQIYPILAKYYIAKGDRTTGNLYIDSVSLAHADYKDEFNSMLLMRTKQELLAEKNKAQEEKLHMQQTMMGGLVVFAVASILISILIFYLYHKKRAAYRKLVVRSQEWARLMHQTTPVLSTPADSDDEILMREVCRLMDEEQLYRDPDLSLEGLAARFDVHRNSLSKAINATQHKNFNHFVNDYRLREAIERLSNADDEAIIYDIAFSCGFNSHQTFYRIFKKETGLSPALFRRNSQKK